MDAELCILEPDPQRWLHPEAVVCFKKKKKRPAISTCSNLQQWQLRHIEIFDAQMLEPLQLPTILVLAMDGWRLQAFTPNLRSLTWSPLGCQLVLWICQKHCAQLLHPA